MQKPFPQPEELQAIEEGVDKDIAELLKPGKIQYVKRTDLPQVELPQPIPEDLINPSHYRKHPSGIECIEVVRHMNFNVGNAIKYLWRYMEKDDPITNLKKAQWYIDDEIRRLEGKR